MYAVPEYGSDYIQSVASATKTATVPASKPTPVKLSAPTWKSATVSGTKITLSWNAVANAGSYKIEYKAGSGSWATLKSGVTSTTYALVGTAGTTYSFRLYAVPKTSAHLQSDASAAKTITIPAPNLSAPTWKSATVSGTKITLSWNAVANAGSYKIEYKAGSGSWATLKSGVTSTTYALVGTAGTTYSFRLYAVPKTSAHLQSLASATKTATVPASKPTPVKLSAPTWKSATVSGAKISLSWNAVANAGSYTIQYKSDSGAWKTLVSGVKTTSYTFTGERGTNYSFRLYANSSQSGYAKSNASATRTRKCDAQVIAPAAKVSYITPNDGRIVLSWAKIAGVLTYTVYYRNEETGARENRTTSANEYNTNLSEKGKYTFWVVPNPVSNTLDVTDYKGTAWNYSTDWQPSYSWVGSNKTSAVVTVRWNAIENAKEYKIYVDGVLFRTTKPYYSFTTSNGQYRGWSRYNLPNSAYGVAVLNDGTELQSKTYYISDFLYK